MSRFLHGIDGYHVLKSVENSQCNASLVSTRDRCVLILVRNGKEKYVPIDNRIDPRSVSMMFAENGSLRIEDSDSNSITVNVGSSR